MTVEENKEVYILGTKYQIKFCDSSHMFEDDNTGECDRYNKIIKINMDLFDESDKSNTENMIAFYRKTLRHEMIHAFFHEMGLDCYSEDEYLVDALAIIFPKMEQTFNKAFFDCDVE